MSDEEKGSWHKDDWLSFGTRITTHISDHPVAYGIAGAVILAFILGRCSA